jgi:hypothetical protein
VTAGNGNLPATSGWMRRTGEFSGAYIVLPPPILILSLSKDGSRTKQAVVSGSSFDGLRMRIAGLYYANSRGCCLAKPEL